MQHQRHGASTTIYLASLPPPEALRCYCAYPASVQRDSLVWVQGPERPSRGTFPASCWENRSLNLDVSSRNQHVRFLPIKDAGLHPLHTQHSTAQHQAEPGHIPVVDWPDEQRNMVR